MIDDSPEAKAQFIAGMVGNGLDERTATIAADMAFHAARQGMMSFLTACDALNGVEWMNAVSIGLQLLEDAASSTSEKFRDTAKLHGAEPREFEVSR